MEEIYTVTKIEGDYAYLLRLSDKEELFIAMALLPLGCDIGSKLKQENFEFTLID